MRTTIRGIKDSQTMDISILKQHATEGQWIDFTTTTGSTGGTRAGFLNEVHDSGIVLKLEDGTISFLPADEIRSFSIPPKTPTPDAISPQSESTAPIPDDVSQSPESERPSATAVAAKEFDLFKGEPEIPQPPLVFVIDRLNEVDQGELVRWKNEYEYALKIRELSRIRDLLPKMTRWAERLGRHEAYTLCGVMALSTGDNERARNMLTAGEARGSAAASMTLAYWDITQKQWEEGVRHIIRSLLRREDNNVDLDPSPLISLGCCLAHSEQREFEGLAGIWKRALSAETKEIAALLVAFALEKRYPDAIKDLAQLLNRRGEADEAIALLDKHRNELGDPRPVDNQKATIYIKARKFGQAIEVFTRLLRETTGPKRIPLYRQVAYCRYRQGDYDGALTDLRTILKISPSDYAARNQIDKIEKIREGGIPLSIDEDTDELRELAEWDTGLSSLAQHLLDSCDFSYVDERSKARGSFDDKDFAATERILEGIRGRRPGEKARVLNLFPSSSYQPLGVCRYPRLSS